MFGKYYYSIFGAVDPEAATLPLPEAKLGTLLSYIVAHEIGHSIGLRHNHIASTAYSVAQLRDPKFANAKGSNSSIMAYGRMNQAAQPGDGVKQLIPVLGPYDFAAINGATATSAQTPPPRSPLSMPSPPASPRTATSTGSPANCLRNPSSPPWTPAFSRKTSEPSA